ncbi:MAG TPA: sulfurtransferase [Candidatus Bathyarchaeia archaeon]|nr:sulfurtransferase [Candidatus Bathyarchaeia archaeon]
MSYAKPEVLVSTDWVKDHLNDPKVRVVEVDYDPTANYQLGHVPGAVLFDWRKDLNNPVQRDILSKQQLEQLFSNSGISGDTKIVLYGDFNNWFAAYAFWDLQYYGVKNLVLMNGGRKKWIEEDKPLAKDIPQYPATKYSASQPDEKIRSYLHQVLDVYKKSNTKLVDVRSPKEFSGEILAPPEYPTEHAQRGGHIPGAVNIPWSQAVKEDGTFKTYEDIKKLYESQGVTADKDIIAYCRIGERSSFSWFVLKYLLGYQKVRNYDGSWTEWGNLVRNPIEKPAQQPPQQIPA